MASMVDWDDDKNRANVKKHGIDFSTVVAVFDDPLLLTLPDPYSEEQRYRSIGAALNGSCSLYTR